MAKLYQEEKAKASMKANTDKKRWTSMKALKAALDKALKQLKTMKAAKKAMKKKPKGKWMKLMLEKSKFCNIKVEGEKLPDMWLLRDGLMFKPVRKNENVIIFVLDEAWNKKWMAKHAK